VLAALDGVRTLSLRTKGGHGDFKIQNSLHGASMTAATLLLIGGRAPIGVILRHGMRKIIFRAWG